MAACSHVTVRAATALENKGTNDATPDRASAIGWCEAEKYQSSCLHPF